MTSTSSSRMTRRSRIMTIQFYARLSGIEKGIRPPTGDKQFFRSGFPRVAEPRAAACGCVIVCEFAQLPTA